MDEERFKIVLDKVPQADRDGEEIRACVEEVRLLEPEMDDIDELRRAATEVGPRDARVFTTT
jgi:hypothetical protein